ncbi:MAG: GNAT family N-acetyltransferase [Nibricoccus sp.]
MNPGLSWQRLTQSDLGVVVATASQIHIGLPERPEVFEEKWRLFPAGCFKLADRDKLAGYGFSHPWRFGEVPQLDDFLQRLPADADCLYLHDAVVLPAYRGQGAAVEFIRIAKNLAAEKQLRHLAMVSVYGTSVFWGGMGFKLETKPELTAKLQSYGPTAKYMTCAI